MALIKCPECGKDVSTAANACPHCGFPINNKINEHSDLKNQKEKEFPKPINSSWVIKWKSKSRNTKIIWTLIFLFCLVGLGISIPFTFIGNLYILTIIFSVLTFFSFVMWLTVLISVKTTIRQYNGYTILVYVGFKHSLVIEDKIQDFGSTNRFLYGQLPNKKQVCVNISVWDNSAKIEVVSEKDEKNIVL